MFVTVSHDDLGFHLSSTLGANVCVTGRAALHCYVVLPKMMNVREMHLHPSYLPFTSFVTLGSLLCFLDLGFLSYEMGIKY